MTRSFVHTAREPAQPQRSWLRGRKDAAGQLQPDLLCEGLAAGGKGIERVVHIRLPAGLLAGAGTGR
ncbi:MAG: hypothetical protein J2P32_02670 [Actinobacteria bacterium]|nr:hypothetical protein [Actinomycetota bacterium]